MCNSQPKSANLSKVSPTCRCPNFPRNEKIIFIFFCLELGGTCTRGTLDFAHPIATPLMDSTGGTNGSQPAGDVSHKPGGRLPLLFARPAVTPATLSISLLGEQRHDGCEQFAQDCYPTTLRLLLRSFSDRCHTCDFIARLCRTTSSRDKVGACDCAVARGDFVA